MLPHDPIAVAEAIEDSETLAQIIEAMRSYASRFGYDRLVLFSVGGTQDEAIDPLYWLEGHWFDDCEPMDAEAYMLRCPITRHVFEAVEPFYWTKIGEGEQELYRVVARPHGRGVHGLQIPVFGPSGLEGAVSFGGVRIDASRRARLALTVVGEAALRSARRLAAEAPMAGPSRLSEREQQVLRWVAAGRRQDDIATTLGLSGRTIENHLRRIRTRLGAKTTAEAVRIAMRSGDFDR